MQADKLSDNWLFKQHAKQELSVWLRQLRYFCFKRALGGHANDGDEFRVAFLYTGKEDLLNKIGQLGGTLNIIPDDYPKSVIGQSYSASEFEKFKSEIKPYTDLEQPGYSIIFGYQVFIWVLENSIQISISGTANDNPYEVTEDDFKACLALENHFDRIGWQNIIDQSLEKSVCCISKALYPELYEHRIDLPDK